MKQWQMHRAGLLNFWYYDQEEFFFADGKLLLRGMNGSGKSVTMQSLITVLLDGKIAANRLDPFGSKDRRMEDYLLGERELVDREERTGYLYLEYKRQDSEQYLTTGIGLKARRGGTIEFWGFVITDNRRIGKDFFLTKTEYNADGQEERIPLTRTELEKLLNCLIPKKALHEYGVKKEELPVFAASVVQNQQRLLVNNPVPFDEARILKIYQGLY